MLLILLSLGAIDADEYFYNAEVNAVNIFPSNTPDATGDLTSSWFITPRLAKSMMIKCAITITTVGTGISSRLEVQKTDGSTIIFTQNGSDVTAGAQNHDFFLALIATPAADSPTIVAASGKKLSPPSRWRYVIDGQNGTSDYTTNACDVWYMR